MARLAREKSEIKTYLVLLKIDNLLNLEQEDINHLLKTICKSFEKSKDKLLAYCAIKTNVWLVVKENEDFSKSLKNSCANFARYYNKKNARTGPVFRDRFESFVATQKQDVWCMASALNKCSSQSTNCCFPNYFENEFVKQDYFTSGLKTKKYVINKLKKIENDPKTQSYYSKILPKLSCDEIEDYINLEFKITLKDVINASNELKFAVCKFIFNFTKASIRQVVKVTGLPFRFVYNSLKKSTVEKQN